MGGAILGVCLLDAVLMLLFHDVALALCMFYKFIICFDCVDYFDSLVG